MGTLSCPVLFCTMFVCTTIDYLCCRKTLVVVLLYNPCCLCVRVFTGPVVVQPLLFVCTNIHWSYCCAALVICVYEH